jgi:hypothetical protein
MKHYFNEHNIKINVCFFFLGTKNPMPLIFKNNNMATKFNIILEKKGESLS